MSMSSMPGGGSTGGKSMGGGAQIGMPGGPQFNPGAGAGFGFNPDTGDAFGIQGNAPAPGMLPPPDQNTAGFNQMFGLPPGGITPDQQGALASQMGFFGMPTNGMPSGKNFALDQMGQSPQLGLPVERPGQGQPPSVAPLQPGVAFGGSYFPPQGQLVGGPAGKPIIGMPGGPQFNPQPVNRFAPPNAPGVRTQPRVSAVNQANPRMVQPNRFSRTRPR